MFLLALLVLHAMLLCGLWLATRMGLKPLASLSERIRQRTADDPTPLARLRDDPLELAPIIAALDAQAAQVARLRSTERFFADAAHELRTPLAVISAWSTCWRKNATRPARRSCRRPCNAACSARPRSSRC